MINEIDSEKYNFFLCAKASELRKTTSILSELITISKEAFPKYFKFSRSAIFSIHCSTDFQPTPNLKERGMYLDLDSLEFPKADNVEELIEAINQKPKKEEYPQFFEQFCKLIKIICQFFDLFFIFFFSPLKAMGRIVPKREYGLGNVQRNFLITDYLLYQNEFSRDVFLNDYMLPNLYQGFISF